jgi:[phosphatase 2A protein]-leucine-carboxy methyltransferase
MRTNPQSAKQIVSLGAGTDTRYFRLRDNYPDANLLYHELDFPTNTAAKLGSIQRHTELNTKLGSTPTASPPPFAPGTMSYHSLTYNLHAIDLRSLAQSDEGATPPPLPNLDPSRPTLILSEMCLIYLQASTVSTILSTFLKKYIPSPTPAALILYEPILPNDAFGQVMISNLASRRIYLPTLSAYPELADQKARLAKDGFVDGARAADTNWIWSNWVSENEKERVAGLEMLDELEELEMLLKHYCVAWGWRDGGQGIFTEAWGDIQDQGGR